MAAIHYMHENPACLARIRLVRHSVFNVYPFHFRMIFALRVSSTLSSALLISARATFSVTFAFLPIGSFHAADWQIAQLHYHVLVAPVSSIGPRFPTTLESISLWLLARITFVTASCHAQASDRLSLVLRGLENSNDAVSSAIVRFNARGLSYT